MQQVDQVRVERIALFRAIERQGQDAAVGRAEESRGHWRTFERRRARAGGTGTSIRKSAVEYTFPCASVLSEMVPPPSSAPCRRKLSAFKFGSSNLSTPLTMPLKCRATRGAVTSRSRIG